MRANLQSLKKEGKHAVRGENKSRNAIDPHRSIIEIMDCNAHGPSIRHTRENLTKAYVA